MAGIFMGMTALIPATPLAGLSIFAGFTAPTLASALGTIALTTLATGTFGAVLQTINYARDKTDSSYASTSPVNARDIAITSVSNGLTRPQIQALLQDAPTHNTPAFGSSVEQSTSTQFRDKVGAEQSLNARLNAILTGNNKTAANHAERVQQERDAAAAAPKAPTLH